MPDTDGTEPIGDHEILYRRIPVSMNWYDPNVEPRVAVDAFRPRPDDTTGISLSRDGYKSIEEAARGRPGKRYYVLLLQAGDLRAAGIEVVPRPEEEDPGHAEIPVLNYQDRKSDRAEEIKKSLAHELTLRVEGPFPP